MELMIQELKEKLLNTTLTLLELDNIIETFFSSTSSLFNYPDEIKREGSCNYYISNNIEIVVEYLLIISDKELEKMSTEEKMKIKAKVIDIWKY